MERLHAMVSGTVQGVSFRYYTRKRALELGLVGWVRNRPDGTVETVAEGERPALEAFLAFLHQGSPDARVARVDARWETALEGFDQFSITATG